MTDKTQEDEERALDLPFETVFESTENVVWRVIRALLEENDIEVRVVGGELSGAQIGVGNQIMSHLIQVPAKDVELAKELLETYQSQSPDDEELARLSQLSVNPQGVVFSGDAKPLNFGEVEIRRIPPFPLGVFFAVQLLFFYGISVVIRMNQGNPIKEAVIAGAFSSIVLGFVAGALFAVLYNIVATWLGGVQLYTFDRSRLLSQTYADGQCFYRDATGRVTGPVTQEALKGLLTESSLAPEAIVQVNDQLLVAGEFLASLDS